MRKMRGQRARRDRGPAKAGLFLNMVALGTGAALVMGVAACGGTPASNQTQSSGDANAKHQVYSPQAEQKWEQQTYEAAKKEGTVTVYGFWDPDSERVTRQYMAQHYPGVKLQAVTTTTAPPKLQAEAASGQHIADAYYGGQTTAAPLAQLQLTQQFHPPAEYLSGAKWRVSPSGYTSYPQIVYGLQGKGVLINTNLVPPDKRPQRWTDLTNSFWKSCRIAIDDPGRGGGPGPSWARWAYNNPSLGSGFLKKLAAQNPVLYKGSQTPYINGVARGEYCANIPSFPSTLIQVPNTPVQFLWMKDGAHATTTIGILLKNAPHPNAAKLFLNMLLLPEYQKEMAKALWTEPNAVGVPLGDPITGTEGHNAKIDDEAQVKSTDQWAVKTGRSIFGGQ